MTAVELEAYAPPSSRMRIRTLTSFPVARRTVLAPDACRMTVHVPRERLLAVVDDLHRAVRVQREHRAVHLHREVLAAAERAADTAEMDPHLLEREPEAGRDLRPVDVQPLRRDVDVDAAFAVGNGEAGLRAEERLILDADVVHALDRDVRRRVGVAVADHHVPHDVRPFVLAVTVTARRLLGMEVGQLGRALHVGDRIEGLVLDDDPLGGTACLLGMLGAPPARPARRSRGRGRSRARADPGTRARTSSAQGRRRASAPRAHRASTRPARCRSRRCVRARAGCAACVPRACPGRSGRSHTQTRPSPSAAHRCARRARRPFPPAGCGSRSAS